ncbi:hypothetical protein [Streptomyces sp. NPDC047028]|uniref:hypothetical protein n=1 Tax=Streptomyces sp. NPDC047028 TaxID=3155793 RepID=UPI0033F014D5
MNMLHCTTVSAHDDLLIEELGTHSDVAGTRDPIPCYVTALPSSRQANGTAAA